MVTAFRTDQVTFQIGDTAIVDRVSVDVAYGELLALVGPNGAGKSTLLGLMTGDRSPRSGSVTLDGTALEHLSAKELARRRAVLAQENHVSFPFHVREVVAMGRSPWRGTDREHDDELIIDRSMDLTDVTHLKDRTFTSLSGGEKSRVSLARVLAQDTSVVLLDEPTAALDLRHQEEVMTVARDLAHAGKAVVVVLHDLSLAAAYADTIAVLHRGQVAALGDPAEVIVPALVQEVYGIRVRVMADPDSGTPLVVPVRG